MVVHSLMKIGEGLNNLVEKGVNMEPLFAYFGPEVQMPLASLLASMMGLLMIAGAAPVRMARRLWDRVGTIALRRDARD